MKRIPFVDDQASPLEGLGRMRSESARQPTAARSPGLYLVIAKPTLVTREKDVFPNALKTDSVRFFGPPVPVEARAVEVRYAKVIHRANVGRRCLNIRMEVHPGSTILLCWSRTRAACTRSSAGPSACRISEGYQIARTVPLRDVGREFPELHPRPRGRVSFLASLSGRRF